MVCRRPVLSWTNLVCVCGYVCVRITREHLISAFNYTHTIIHRRTYIIIYIYEYIYTLCRSNIGYILPHMYLVCFNYVWFLYMFIYSSHYVHIDLNQHIIHACIHIYYIYIHVYLQIVTHISTIHIYIYTLSLCIYINTCLQMLGVQTMGTVLFLDSPGPLGT